DEARKRDLREIADALDGALSEYIVRISQPTRPEHTQPTVSLDLFRARATHLSERGALDEVAEHLVRIGDLLSTDIRELPRAGAPTIPAAATPFPTEQFFRPFLRTPHHRNDAGFQGGPLRQQRGASRRVVAADDRGPAEPRCHRAQVHNARDRIF